MYYEWLHQWTPVLLFINIMLVLAKFEITRAKLFMQMWLLNFFTSTLYSYVNEYIVKSKNAVRYSVTK